MARSLHRAVVVDRRTLPYLVGGGSLALTALATSLVYASARGRDRARFDNAVQSMYDRVSARLDTYVATLHGVRGMFEAATALKRPLTEQAFSAYVAALEVRRRYPGVQGIGFSVVVPANRRAELEANLRAQDPSFHLWPAGERAEYHAIVYLRPLDKRNRAAIGYDMATDSTRHEAMIRARDSGHSAMSGPVSLVQEISGQHQSGFLLYEPVYRKEITPGTVEERRAELEGFVYAPFRMDDLFRGIFGGDERPRVLFRVFNGTDTTSGSLLHDSRTLLSRPSVHGSLNSVRTLSVGGRVWTLVFDSVPAPDPFSAPIITVATAVLGLLLSGTLVWLARVQASAQRALEASTRTRTRFFAAASHELRTPINAIIGYNALLLEDMHGQLTAGQRRAIDRSQRAARHLLELVNDVLDMSKLEAGKIEIAPETVRIPELLRDLASTIEPQARSRGSELRFDCRDGDVPIETDPQRVRQILLNLLSNATKFGAGKPVELSCSQTRDGGVSIRVRDEGPGIPLEDQARIFEEFVQLPSSDAKGTGTGLGLAISRRLAECLNGTLEVESAPGKGSTFVLTLPQRVVVDRGEGAAASPSSN